MGNEINGSGQQYIDFGNHKVEIGKSDGVKRDSLNRHVAMNNTLNSIFNKFDTNGDGNLDNVELENLYQQYIDAAKNGKMSEAEAKAFAKQLGLEGVDRTTLGLFLEAVSNDGDDFSGQWEDNVYTERDGNSTVITEYSDNEHTQIARQTVKNGDMTTITENNENGKVVTTILGSEDNVLSKKIEEINADGKLTKKTEIKSDGTSIEQIYDADGETVIDEIKKDKDGNIIQPDNGKINYLELPEINKTMIVYLMLRYRNDPPASEYFDTLAKFPDVSAKELANLLRTYPDTGVMIMDYFSDSDPQVVKENFGNFLNHLGINYNQEGYFIGTGSNSSEGVYYPTLCSFGDRKPMSQADVQSKILEFITT